MCKNKRDGDKLNRMQKIMKNTNKIENVFDFTFPSFDSNWFWVFVDLDAFCYA